MGTRGKARGCSWNGRFRLPVTRRAEINTEAQTGLKWSRPGLRLVLRKTLPAGRLMKNPLQDLGLVWVFHDVLLVIVGLPKA